MYSVKELLVNCRPAGQIMCNVTHSLQLQVHGMTHMYNVHMIQLIESSSGRKPVQKVMTVS